MDSQSLKMEGYAKVAQLMSKYEEFAIFRSFKRLNYQNLLYLQAQITHLEQELGKIVHRDTVNTYRQFYAKDWWSLANGKGKNARDQWRKVLRIRKMLSMYSELAAERFASVVDTRRHVETVKLTD